jgi:HAD superfamily hydrolase (TIGR01549 family)
MKNLKLLIFDVGGVFRDSSLAIYEGYKRGFNSVNMEFNFSPQEIWHLRGMGKYNSSKNAIKAMLVLSYQNKELQKTLNKEEAEEILDGLISSQKIDVNKITKIHFIYKNFFSSEEAGKYIKLFPFAKEAINKLKEKGYELAILTNASIETVKRDLPFYNKFSLIFGEENVAKKPSGEGIIKIYDNLGYSSEETGYVGDSTVDILAAKDAKVTPISVLSGMGLKIHLEKLNPDYIFKDILELSELL